MKKPLLIIFLILALGLSACGGNAAVAQNTAPLAAAPAETAIPTMPSTVPSIPEEEQLRILENNRAQWAFEDPYDSPWFHTFTDLDRNGRLEVIAATTQGTGIFTYVHYYEVRADGSGIDNCYHADVEIEGPDDWPEIVMDSLPCYYDAVNDRCYYVCEGITRDGYAHQYYTWQALCLKDGVADWEFIASKNVNWDENGAPTTECRDAKGNTIAESEYDSAVEQRFAGLEKSELTLNWIQEENSWEDAEENNSSGWLDEPGEDTSAADGPQIVITKNPTSEALTIGGKTWFIAHADNAETISWQLVDPQGTVYTLDSAMTYHPGLVLEVLEGDTIAVSSVPLSLNGWGIQARFDGRGGFAITEPAYIYVGDFLTPYSNIIGKYRAAYETGNSQNLEYSSNNDISEMTAYSGGVGYAMKDLDKNGIPELIIAGMGTEDFSNNMVYDLYTLVNNEPVNLATSRARMRYYLRSDNTILYEGSGGASYSYFTIEKLENNTLTELEMIFTNMDQDTSGAYYTGYYYQQGHSETLPSEHSIAISEEEFGNRLQQMESSFYIPPLTAIY